MFFCSMVIDHMDSYEAKQELIYKYNCAVVKRSSMHIRAYFFSIVRKIDPQRRLNVLLPKKGAAMRYGGREAVGVTWRETFVRERRVPQPYS